MIDWYNEICSGKEGAVFPYTSDTYTEGFCIKVFEPKYKTSIYKSKNIYDYARRYGLTCLAECVAIVDVNDTKYYEKGLVMKQYEGDLFTYATYLNDMRTCGTSEHHFARILDENEVIEKMIRCVNEFHSIGRIWCDLKLENFLIDTKTRTIVIADYGDSVLENSPIHTYTPMFAPPELQNSAIASKAVDNFSLGWALCIFSYFAYPFPVEDNGVVTFEFDESVLKGKKVDILIRNFLHLEAENRITCLDALNSGIFAM